MIVPNRHGKGLLCLIGAILLLGGGETVGRDEEGWVTNTAFTPVGNPDAKKGGMLRLSLPEFPKALRPEGPYSRQRALKTIHGLLYEPLLRIDPETRGYVPCLASHWRFSKDKQTFWFRVDARAKWSDGEAVTAADVVATWRYLSATHIDGAMIDAVYARGFREVEAEDRVTVRVRLWRPNWRRFFSFASLAIYPASFLRHRGDLYEDEYYLKIPKGSGAYELRDGDIRWGRSITLRRRKDYWAAADRRNTGLYNYDRIQWTAVRGMEEALRRFHAGEFDVFVVEDPAHWVKGGDAEGFGKGWIQRRKVYTEKPASFSAFVFNLRLPPFNDLRVRLAFSQLIDRKKIKTMCFHDEVEVADSYYPGRKWCAKKSPKIQYNAKAAALLLTQAGFRRKKEDGLFYTGPEKSEKVFRINFLYSDAAWKSVLEKVAADLQAVGIRCILNQVNRHILWGSLPKNKFAVHFMTWETSLLPDPGPMWSSVRGAKGGTNLAGFQSKEVDKYCNLYYLTEEPKKRIPLLQKIDLLVYKEHPFALGWYVDHTNLFYWDKFGHPATLFSRTGDADDILAAWWIDPEKEKTLLAAKRSGDALPVGETLVDPWNRRKQ
ncbi:MAG: ABC transporter substrate-binding protein [Planctomycetota bacterium]